jgi:heme/copper-type cytochrome/quinol oxidase subunit 2
MGDAWKERLSVLVVLLTLVGVPGFGWYYDRIHLPRTLAQGETNVRIVDLTGIAIPGMWTTDSVAGWNYWWRRPRRTQEVRMKLGETLILRLHSADVTHGFSLPTLGIPDQVIEPGHVVTVRIKPDRAGAFPFSCVKVCSCTGEGFACMPLGQGHEAMKGYLLVEEELGEPDVVVRVTISEENGFQPDTIRVRQGQVVQVEVTSLTDGTGDGVGFCIMGYETKVDLQGIRRGETRRFKFRADKPGEFIVYSSTAAGPAIDNAFATFIVEGEGEAEGPAEPESEEEVWQ